MKKIFFVIGASGSGKTTVLKALDRARLSEFKIVYFDSIGVPSLDEMNAKYNGPEEWQRIKTIDWVKTIKETLISDNHVILDGQTRPTFIQEACIKNEITNYKIILFDCSDKERTRRLVDRKQPELANENMMNWAKYLREQSQTEGFKIINNTNLTVEETIFELVDFMKY